MLGSAREGFMMVWDACALCSCRDSKHWLGFCTTAHAFSAWIGWIARAAIPVLPYDPGEQGDPLHADAPVEKYV